MQIFRLDWSDPNPRLWGSGGRLDGGSGYNFVARRRDWDGTEGGDARNGRTTREPHRARRVKLRDVGRAVTAEAATHLDRLKKSERTKEAVDKSVAFAAEALEDPDKIKEAARKVWAEDQKVQAIKDRTKTFLENTMESEERMEKVSTLEMMEIRSRPRVAYLARGRLHPRLPDRPARPSSRTDRMLPYFPQSPTQARNLSSRVFSVVESLASKGRGEGGGNLPRSRSQAPGPAQHRAGQPRARGERQGGRQGGVDAAAVPGWRGGALEGIQGTVQRVTQRLKEVLKALQQQQAERNRKEADADAIEADAYKRATDAGVDHDSATAAAAAAREMSGHVTFTTGADGKLVMTAADGQSVDVGDNDAMTKLAREGRSVWQEVRTDEQVQRLLKEEIAPGFRVAHPRIRRGHLRPHLHPRAPRGSTALRLATRERVHHVDNLAFSEFSVGKDGLRVENQTRRTRITQGLAPP